MGSDYNSIICTNKFCKKEIRMLFVFSILCIFHILKFLIPLLCFKTISSFDFQMATYGFKCKFLKIIIFMF